MNYLEFANSYTMLLICAIPVTFVTFQAILFLKKSYNRGIELGMSKADLNRVIRNSGIFTIVPALPILIFLIILAPSLGKFLPWLRLSVIGSGAYENIVANATLKSLGLDQFGQLDLQGFIVIMLTMTVSILAGVLGTIFLLKPYSKKLQSIESKKGGFGEHLIPAIFIGMIVAIAAPYFIPKNVVDATTQQAHYEIQLIPIFAFISGFVMFIVFTNVSKKIQNRVLGEFAFPLSIVVGMLVAIIFTQLGVGAIIL